MTRSEDPPTQRRAEIPRPAELRAPAALSSVTKTASGPPRSAPPPPPFRRGSTAPPPPRTRSTSAAPTTAAANAAEEAIPKAPKPPSFPVAGAERRSSVPPPLPDVPKHAAAPRVAPAVAVPLPAPVAQRSISSAPPQAPAHVSTLPRLGPPFSSSPTLPPRAQPQALMPLVAPSLPKASLPASSVGNSRFTAAWLVGVLALIAAGAVAYFHYLPLVSAHRDLQTLQRETAKALSGAQKSAIENRALYDKSEANGTRLAAQLAQEVRQKEEALATLARAQAELSSSLESQIADGELLVVQRDGKLVVDVADKVLFAQGNADVTVHGKQVLAQVADTLARIQGFTFEVSGHTDSARITSPATAKLYPTNWELSTARATNVVRFLEATEKVKGGQLVALGYAEHRPVAQNVSKLAMARNRRIEITLVPTTSK